MEMMAEGAIEVELAELALPVLAARGRSFGIPSAFGEASRRVFIYRSSLVSCLATYSMHHLHL